MDNLKLQIAGRILTTNCPEGYINPSTYETYEKRPRVG